jgi:hypothetical protein
MSGSFGKPRTDVPYFHFIQSASHMSGAMLMESLVFKILIGYWMAGVVLSIPLAYRLNIQCQSVDTTKPIPTGEYTRWQRHYGYERRI